MKILVINNDGGGFADYMDVADGTTVTQLFEQQIGSAKSSNYLTPRQPPALPCGSSLAGKRSDFHHADQDRRRVSLKH